MKQYITANGTHMISVDYDPDDPTCRHAEIIRSHKKPSARWFTVTDAILIPRELVEDVRRALAGQEPK